MRKVLFAGVACVAAVGLLASPASAATGFGPWKPLPHSAPFSFSGCGTPVTVSYPVQKEVQRTRTDPGGNTIIEVKGPFSVRVTPKDKAHYRTVTRDASGAALDALHQIAYKDGDFLYAADGNNFLALRPVRLRHTGLPRLALTRGNIRVLFPANRDRPADVITRPRSVENLCQSIKR